MNSGTFNSTGTTTFTGTQVQNIQFTNAISTAFNIANFNGTIAPVFASTTSPTFNTITINNTAGVSPSLGWTVNTAFTVSAGSSFTGNNGVHNFYGSFTNNGTISSSGTLNISPTSAQTVLLKGTSFSSTGILAFGGSGAITVNGVPNSLTHVNIANTTGVTPTSNWSLAGNFTIANTGVFNAGTYSYTVAGDMQSSGTLNGGTSTFTLTGSGNTLSGTANTTFYDLIISGNIVVNADYRVARNFTNNGTYDGTNGALIMTGATAATIGGTASPFNLAQLTIQKTSATVTLGKSLSSVSILTLSSGILDASTFGITQDAVNGGTMDIQNSSTLRIGGTNSLPAFNTTTIAAGTTVEYYGSTQTITSLASQGKTYGNLVVTSAGTKTANGPLNILGNLTVSTATFVPGSFTDTLAGNFTMTSGSFTNTGNSLVLNGTANQSITANGSFNNLRIDKAGGTTTLLSDITLAGTLTFTLGKIITGSYTVISTSGTISGAAQETGWVNGNFRRTFSSGALTGSFPIGGVNYYTPFSLSFGSISSAGAITGSNGGVHAQLATSGITLDKNIARTWTVTNTGSVAFTNYAITFNWNASQNYANFDSTLLKVALYNNSSWTTPTISGTPTSTTITSSGNTLFGDYIVGERCNVNGNFSYAATGYCTNGSNAQVIIAPGSTSGAFSSTPAGLSINSTSGLITVSTSAVKSYTVYNTVTGTGGCSSTSSFAVMISAPPSATISYSGGPFCTSDNAVAVTRTGNNGGTYTTTAGLTINATTGSITPSTSTPGTYTVTYTIAAANGCTQFQTTAQVVLKGYGYWTGTTNTDWFTATNWQCGGVPAAGSNVIIPGSITNYPNLNRDSVAVNNLTIQSGASLIVVNAKVKIAGTISNSGTLTASNGSVEFNGSIAQSIASGLFSSNTVKQLYINNNAGVTLNGPLDITTLLKIDNGSLATNGYLTLKSSYTTTAQIGQITSAHSTPIVGNVTVERFVLGRRKYRLICSSVTTSPLSTLSAGQEANSIWGNWQLAGSTAVQNQGTSITGGLTSDGFDQITYNPSLFTYDDVTRKYVAFSSANNKNTKYTPLKAGKAYYMFVYGDRQNSAGASSPRPTVLKATGTVLTGTQDYTTSSSTPLSDVTGRFTLIGNPFASPINWATIPKNNLSNTFWGWDPNLNNTGGYVTVSTAGGVTLIAPFSGSVGLNQYIQPGQGFFVKTTGSSPTLSIREQDKTTNNNSIAFRSESANDIPLIAANLFYPSAGIDLLADGAVAAFDDRFSNEVNDEDAQKMAASTETLGIMNGNDLLSIDARKMPGSGDTIYLYMERVTKPQYTLQIFSNQMAAARKTMYLQDTYLNTVQSLSLSDTNNIVFNVITGNVASSSPTRFRIFFRDITTLPISFKTIKATIKQNDVLVEWSVADQNGTRKYEIEHSVNGTNFKLAGEVDAIGNNGLQDYQWLHTRAVQGYNYYRVNALTIDGRYVSSSIVKINFAAVNQTAASIRIYPNPVKDQRVNVEMTNMPKGRYSLELMTIQGRILLKENFDHAGGTGIRSIVIGTPLKQGMYYINVYSDNSRFTKPVIIE